MQKIKFGIPKISIHRIVNFFNLLCPYRTMDIEINDLDIELARALHKIWEKEKTTSTYPQEETGFEKAIDAGDLVLVITHHNIGTLIGKGGRIVRQMTKHLGKKVRIINSKDTKTAIQDLVAPARLKGLNVVYTPEGEMLKAKIRKTDQDKLIAELPILQKAAEKISSQKIELELE